MHFFFFFCSLEFNIIKKDQSSFFFFYVRRSRILNFVEIAKKSVKVLCWSIWWYGVDQRHITALYLTGDCCTRTENTHTHAQAFKITFFPCGSDTVLRSTVMSWRSSERQQMFIQIMVLFNFGACKRDNIAFKNVHQPLLKWI